jgi:hypothetical protein
MRAVALALCLVAAGQSGGRALAQDNPQAPQTPPSKEANDDVRISGTVEKFQGGLISISPSQGVTLTVRFDAGPGINSMRKGKVSDLKTGSPVTAEAKSNPTGGLMASQVVVYESGSETVAGTQASTDPTQVVARLAEIGSTPEGPQLSLTYKDGDRKITLAKDAVIWIARPASAADIKPGSLITIAGRKPPEGEIKVMKASIGPSGGENPPL